MITETDVLRLAQSHFPENTISWIEDLGTWVRHNFRVHFSDRKAVVYKFNVNTDWIDSSVHEYRVTEILEKNGMTVRYEKTLKKAYWLLYSEKAGAILVPKRVTKDEVVKTARRGDLFPPKTTRHMLPKLNKFVDIPLSELV